MRPERENCPMRHENGNCMPAGGFCTAVNDPICQALHNAYNAGYINASITVRLQLLVEKHVPLTLDELRRMDGDPIWIAEIDKWALVYVRHNGYVVLQFGDGSTASAEGWLKQHGPVYRHKRLIPAKEGE